MRPDGSIRNFQGSRGAEARFRRDGSMRDVRSRDLTISRGAAGGRRVIRERPDHSIVVAEGRGHGYIQRPFSHRNHNYFAREFHGDHGRFVRFYEPYRYRGFALNVFIPVRYYPPVFYGWAYAAWPRSIYYRWGWLNDPWYPYYGQYFTPFPAYPSASMWLTDYLLGAALEQDYRERAAAAEDEALGFVPPCDTGQIPLSNEVKQAIAGEVRFQLSVLNEQGQIVSRGDVPDPAASGLPRLLSDNKPHTFVVSSSLDVMSGIEECSLTPGDVLQLNGAQASGSNTVYLQVLAGKTQSCPTGSVVSMSFEDLQNIHNGMRETVDQGLTELQSKQGQGGLPAAPAGALRGLVQAPFASAAPPADPNSEAILSQTEQEGDVAEKEVLGEVYEPPANPATEPGTIQLGQTIERVTAILGPPTQVVDLGTKKIYVYKNMKITFLSGKVTDVQ